MTVPGFGSSDVGQRYGHVVAAEESQRYSRQTLAPPVRTPLPRPLYPSDPFLFPVFPPRADLRAPSGYEKRPPPQKSSQQRCHRRADYATRLKKQAEGPIIFRPNKRDFKVFVEAEQVDGREA